MKVLSWDVGVKNLAGCILEFEPPEKKKSNSEKQKTKDNIKVEDISYPFWGVINLLEEDETEQVCMAVKATKFTKSNPIPQPVICGKKAKFFGVKNNKKYYYCACHKSEYEKVKLDMPEIQEIDKTQKQEDKQDKLINTQCCYKNKNSETICGKKSKYYLQLQQENPNIGIVQEILDDPPPIDVYLCTAHYKSFEKLIERQTKLNSIKKSNFNNISIDKVKLSMWHKLDKMLELQQVDHVIIENQPVLRNPRMKTISETLFNYFLCRGIVDKERTKSTISLVRNISPCNKLKLENDNTVSVLSKSSGQTEKYKLTKQLGIQYCKQILELIKKKQEEDTHEYERLYNIFNERKKQDDLADCMLQGIYYIHHFFYNFRSL